MSKSSDQARAAATGDAGSADPRTAILAGLTAAQAEAAAAAWRIGVQRIPAGRLQAVLAGQPAPSWVGTFHGLGARQLRAEPEVVGLRQGFDILDADDSKRLVKRTLKAMQIDADKEAATPATRSS